MSQGPCASHTFRACATCPRANSLSNGIFYCNPTLTPPQARNGMRAQLAADTAAEQQLPGSVAGAWKWALRKQIWDFMEENDIAR